MTASDGAGPDREAHSRRGPWPTCDCLIHAGAHQSCWPPSMKCPCWRAPTPPTDEPRQHCDRCHRPLPHTDAERAACPPADGVEVREEWGVRWEADHHGVMRRSDSWFDTDAQRKSFCTYFHPEIDPRGGQVLAFATRTATYTTTRWEPQP